MKKGKSPIAPARNAWPCECLDLVEAAHRDRVYPLMYCHIDLAGPLDAARLKQAVDSSAKIIPELLCVYDFSKNCFREAGYTAGDVVTQGAPTADSLRPDLSARPQVQLFFVPQQNHTRMTVMMSHLLTDGDGFLQYLYLLAGLYNGTRVPALNSRRLAPFPQSAGRTPPFRHSRKGKPASLRPPCSGQAPEQLHCITSQLSAASMQRLYQNAKQAGVTLNDVFMAAYARVIARMQRADTVALSCPANLRRFSSLSRALTVANMTGIYRPVPIAAPPGRPFDTVLEQVHREMERQKAERSCLDGARVLYRLFYKVPKGVLAAAIRSVYSPSPISYTNIGAIQDKRLVFGGCTVQSCFLTGTYRLPPDFQLTISTFQNVCTLNCTLLGSAEDRQRGQYILEQVKEEIIGWLEASSL